MKSSVRFFAVCALVTLAMCAMPSAAQAVRQAIDASGKVRISLPLLTLAPDKSRHDPAMTQLRFGGSMGSEFVSLEMHLPIAAEWNGLRQSLASTTMDAWVSPVWLGADDAQCEALLVQLAKLFNQKAAAYKCSGRAIAIAYTKTDPAKLSTAPVEVLIRFDSADQARHAVINFTIDLPNRVLVIEELNTDSVNRLAFLNGFAREGM